MLVVTVVSDTIINACLLMWGMALQHEDGQAWAEAEMPDPAEPAKQELLTDLATCHISGTTELDQSVGSTDVMELDLARSIIQDCSVIVGIHPDQVRYQLLASLQHLLTSRLSCVVL